jgi:hypothetical protein
LIQGLRKRQDFHSQLGDNIGRSGLQHRKLQILFLTVSVIKFSIRLLSYMAAYINAVL